MTPMSPEFLAQLDGVRKRAEREKATITKLEWRNGHLSAELTPKRKQRDVETYVECDWYYGGECNCSKQHKPAHRISRGVQQRLL